MPAAPVFLHLRREITTVFSIWRRFQGPAANVDTYSYLPHCIITNCAAVLKDKACGRTRANASATTELRLNSAHSLSSDSLRLTKSIQVSFLVQGRVRAGRLPIFCAPAPGGAAHSTSACKGALGGWAIRVRHFRHETLYSGPGTGLWKKSVFLSKRIPASKAPRPQLVAMRS